MYYASVSFRRTVGFVWDLFDSLSMSVDYYDIQLENQVGDISSAYILENEANCRLGVSENGATAYDINSPTCQDVLAQVTRKPASDPVSPNGIDEVETYPINLSKQKQTGLQANVEYKWSTDTLGNPYALSLYDGDGMLGLDLGVYGAPETFLIDGNGIIRYRHAGDLNARVWQQDVLPLPVAAS